MNQEDKKLLAVFYNGDIPKEDGKYIFEMENGDIFKVEYYGEGISEINPLTGEDDSFYAIDFLIIDVITDSSNQYCKDAIIEISKYNFPKIIQSI